ncbi:MAG TPA: tetratricopeptide repeat protein [Methanothrix soehngenii]|nr:tetratricopeptide repeat protein [Methanothrix soehngenii]HPS92285.1 tetratricopeptide repeat protein [Methanothrix sp.]
MAKSRDGKRWYELPILVTVLGSLLLLIGNVVTNLVPIMFGAEDSSDFYITIDNVYIEPNLITEQRHLDYSNILRERYGEPETGKTDQRSEYGFVDREWLPKETPLANVTVYNRHEYLRKYDFPVYIKAIGAPSNIIITFDPPQAVPKFSSNMSVYIKTNASLLSSDNIIGYPITIQGIGGDGKKRNCTAYIYFIPPKFHVNDIGIPRMMSGDYEGALESFDAAISLNRSYAEAWNYKGKALHSIGYHKYRSPSDKTSLKEEEEALRSFQEAIKLNNSYEDARYNCAFALYNLKEYNLSLNELKTITRKNDSSERAWQAQGLVQKLLGNYNESFIAYNKTFSLKQFEFSAAWDFIDLGDEASVSNDYETALKAYARASEIESDYTEPIEKRLMLLYKLDRLNESMELANKSIESHPDDAYFWIYKGLALSKLGMRAASENAFAAARMMYLSSDSWNELSWELYKLKQYNESLRLADTAIEIDPNSSYSWSIKGAVLIELGKNEAAIASLERAPEKDHSAWNFFLKANALTGMGNDQEALKFYEKAIQEEPYSADGWYGKAEVLRRLGRAADSEKALNKAGELHEQGYDHYIVPDFSGLIGYLPARSI